MKQTNLKANKSQDNIVSSQIPDISKISITKMEGPKRQKPKPTQRPRITKTLLLKLTSSNCPYTVSNHRPLTSPMIREGVNTSKHILETHYR